MTTISARDQKYLAEAQRPKNSQTMAAPAPTTPEGGINIVERGQDGIGTVNWVDQTALMQYTDIKALGVGTMDSVLREYVQPTTKNIDGVHRQMYNVAEVQAGIKNYQASMATRQQEGMNRVIGPRQQQPQK